MTIELTPAAALRFAATAEAYNALQADGVTVTEWPLTSGAYKYIVVAIDDVPPEQAQDTGAAVLAVAMSTGSHISIFLHNGAWNFRLALAFYDVVPKANAAQ